MLRLTSLISSIVVICLAAGCQRQSNDDSQPASTTVQRGTVEVAIEEIGLVESSRVASILAPFRGRIIQILDDGTPVEEGEVVATLDTTRIVEELEEQLESLKSVKKDLESQIESMTMDQRSNMLDKSSAMAELDLARVQLADVNQELGELEYLRNRNIVEGDAVREAESSLRRTEISTSREDTALRSLVVGSKSAEAQNEVSIQRLKLRGEKNRERIIDRQDELDRAQIKAPVSGMFSRHKDWNWQLRRRVERQVGEEVRGDEILGQIPDLESLFVRTQVPESEMLYISAGAEVTIKFEALGNLETTGVVRTIAPIAIERETSAGGQVTASGQTLTGEKVFEVEVEISDPDTRLRPGLTALAKILIQSHENVLKVPLEAIVTENGKHFVYTLEGEKTVKKEVKIGIANDTVVEITEGLSEGETVLLETTAQLSA